MPMLYTLKKEVLEANLKLVEYNLVNFTWGNVSGIDREDGIVVIKPSGVPYDELKIDQMVVMDLDGNIIEGDLNPSSDTPTHLKLYKKFEHIGGVCHTHSPWATCFSQAKRGIPALGTTHADHFRGEIPCTRLMTEEEIKENYEANTGSVIIETFDTVNPYETPGVLVAAHGPFSWGYSAADSVKNAAIMENVAEMAYRTFLLNSQSTEIDKVLLDKHYLRKHGKDAYYGQG